MKQMGVTAVMVTTYRAISRLAPQRVNIVPVPKNMDPFRYIIACRILGHGSAIAEATKDNYSEDVSELLNDVATGYMLCHAIYQAYSAGGGKLSLVALFDSLIFDGLASAIIPCFFTYHMTRITHAVLGEISAVPQGVFKWGPMIMAISVLAVTYESIDRCVEQALDETIRVLY